MRFWDGRGQDAIGPELSAARPERSRPATDAIRVVSPQRPRARMNVAAVPAVTTVKDPGERGGVLVG